MGELKKVSVKIRGIEYRVNCTEEEEYIEKLAIGMENANYSFDKYCTKKKVEDFDKLDHFECDFSNDVFSIIIHQ